MEKEINLKSDEALDYIKNNVENYDTLEISFNRIFVPGEVLDIDADDEESLKLLIQMNGELVNDTVQIDLVRIKNDILEIRHIKDDKSILIIVDA
jgi:hypothetical protein